LKCAVLKIGLVVKVGYKATEGVEKKRSQFKLVGKTK
jgi:hypothetical protein